MADTKSRAFGDNGEVLVSLPDKSVKLLDREGAPYEIITVVRGDEVIQSGCARAARVYSGAPRGRTVRSLIKSKADDRTLGHVVKVPVSYSPADVLRPLYVDSKEGVNVFGPQLRIKKYTDIINSYKDNVHSLKESLEGKSRSEIIAASGKFMSLDIKLAEDLISAGVLDNLSVNKLNSILSIIDWDYDKLMEVYTGE